MSEPDEFEELREIDRRAKQRLPEEPRMHHTAEPIRNALDALRERWARNETSEAEFRKTEIGARSDVAHELLKRRLPPFVNVPMDKLRARITREELTRAVDGWHWGSHSLVMCGPTRVGKTTAAALLVRRLLARGTKAGGDDWLRAQRFSWHHAAALANARKRHPLGERDAPDIVEATGASILVIDDLGWDHDADVVSEVLNGRYERGAPTIITTGREPEELLERYGDAVFRRIFEAGGKGSTVSLFAKKAKPKQ